MTMTCVFILYYFLGIIFYDLLPGPLQFIDEVFPWLLISYVIVKHKFRVSGRLLTLLGIFLFYFLYSIVIKSNRISAMLFDSIIQIKPFLSYFAILYIAPGFNKRQKFSIRVAMLCGAAVILAIGIGRMGAKVETFQGQMLTGARYSFAALYTGIAYLFFSDRKIKALLTSFTVILFGFFAPTSKFLGGVCLLPLTYAITSEKFKRYRLLLIAAGCMVCLPLFLNIFKDFSFYFESEEVARAALYMTAGRIFLDYIPFGSGLASFGTSASANSYSALYYRYDISDIFGISESSIASGQTFISDAYAASLAEFGIAGLAIIICFFVSCIRKSQKKEKIFAIFLVMDIVMESIADSTIIGNRGVFAMMLLALCDSKKEIAVRHD